MNFKEQVALEANTIVAFLKTDRINQLIMVISSVRECQENPIGGWKEWGYDKNYSWNTYIETRKHLGAVYHEASSLNKWCEIGFSPIPFLACSPAAWNRIGLVEHPLVWIKKAMKNKYHTTAGDGVGMNLFSAKDYAKVWVDLTKKIADNCKTFRIEDVLGKQSVPDLDVWDIVAEEAENLGYTKTGYSDFLPTDPQESRNIEIASVNKTVSVSVIVAARNNGPYLKDALHSAWNQSLLPLEVIYVDDGSTDNSLEVARSFPNVKVISKSWTGVCESRNTGSREAEGDYLLHLDGDDILPFHYIENRWNALTNSTASFCYGNAQAFGGGFNYLWTCPQWTNQNLWAANYCNTASLLRKDHFWQIGGWREGIGTAWDWDLFLRFGKAGYTGLYEGNAALLYRHHEKSISQVQNLKNDLWVSKMNYLFRNNICRTQIASVMSDRIIDLFPTWLAAVVENIEEYRKALTVEKPFPYFGQSPFNKPDLNILYTGDVKHRKFINKCIDEVGENFNSINLMCDRWVNNYTCEEERRDNVATFLAKSYNRLLETDCDLVWFLEDDVIPPPNAMRDLNSKITNTQVPLFAAAGVYRNRHDESHIIAHDWPDLENVGSIKNFRDFPKSDVFVDMTGTGCLMIFKPYANHRFESHVKGVPAHDWAWCLRLRENNLSPVKRVLLLSNVQCRHHHTVDDYI